MNAMRVTRCRPGAARDRGEWTRMARNTSWAPRDRKEHHALGHYLQRLVQTHGPHAHTHPGSANRPVAHRWPEKHTWIMAVDYRSTFGLMWAGTRVAGGVFGVGWARVVEKHLRTR